MEGGNDILEMNEANSNYLRLNNIHKGRYFSEKFVTLLHNICYVATQKSKM
jgi:hypothetical protein